MASANDVSRITAEIANGVLKQDSTVTLTDELSALWDQIEMEIAEIRARGLIVEIPGEMPDVQLLSPDSIVEP
jgi:hypothetical protein